MVGGEVAAGELVEVGAGVGGLIDGRGVETGDRFVNLGSLDRLAICALALLRIGGNCEHGSRDAAHCSAAKAQRNHLLSIHPVSSLRYFICFCITAGGNGLRFGWTRMLPLASIVRL